MLVPRSLLLTRISTIADLLAFGHARRRPGVNIRVLTSARRLKESSTHDPDGTSGLLLERTLDKTFTTHLHKT